MFDTEGEYAGGGASLRGRSVHAWSDGEHYAVEFMRPFPYVVSLARADIQPA